MSTDLINVNDTCTWWPPTNTFSGYTTGITSSTGNTYDLVFYDELHDLQKAIYVPIDPKLERQYNFARAKNNKNEMRRLEKLIANNKQGRYR